MSNSTFPLTGQAPVLPPDPYDALTLENDIVGLRLWGPAPQPTSCQHRRQAQATSRRSKNA